MGQVSKPIGAIKKGLKADFFKAFDNAEDPSDVMPFTTETTSDGSDEEYGWLGNVANLEEWVDDRQLKGLRNFDYTIPNKHYEGTLQVDRDDMADDRLGQVKVRINDLARKAKTHFRKLFFETLESGTVELAYDGQPFFSNSHLEGDSGLQDNLQAGTGTTLAQLKNDIETAEATLLSFKDDQGEPFNEGEIQIGIICHPTLKSQFKELNTQKQINSSSNSLIGMIKQLTVSSRLTDVNDWYFSDISPGIKAIIKQKRQDPTFESQEADSEMGFMRKKFAFGIDYRVGVGFGLWQKMIKVTN